MPHRITADCICCGACLWECPEEAIREGDPCYVIDMETCSDCGNCAEICPTDACVPDAGEGESHVPRR